MSECKLQQHAELSRSCGKNLYIPVDDHACLANGAMHLSKSHPASFVPSFLNLCSIKAAAFDSKILAEPATLVMGCSMSKEQMHKKHLTHDVRRCARPGLLAGCSFATGCQSHVAADWRLLQAPQHQLQVRLQAVH